jgi:serine/threonine protein phosphatase PrpC
MSDLSEAHTSDELIPIEMAASSEKSPLHDRNEDAYFVSAGTSSFGVFDGVSLSDNSADVSRYCSRMLEDMFKTVRGDDLINPGKTVKKYKELMSEAFEVVNEKVIKRDPENERRGMAAAVAGMFVKTPEGEDSLVYGFCGNVRLMVLRGDSIQPLTLDHKAALWKNYPTLQERLAAQTRISSIENPSNLAGDEKAIYMSPNIFKAFGMDNDVVANIGSSDVWPGDIFVAYTDGLENLTLNEIRGIIKDSLNPGEAVRTLTEKALERSMEKGPRSVKDDITVAVLKV